MRHVLAYMFVFAGVGMYALLFASLRGGATPEPPPRLNISSAFVIALVPETAEDLRLQAIRFLGSTDAVVIKAVNGTQALALVEHELPLYTRGLLHWGRHDHMQLYSGATVGCLLSHMKVWASVEGVAVVLEEDAILDERSRYRLEGVVKDMQNMQWDLIMLESGHFGLTGSWRYIGGNVATCANWTTKECGWMGSRGYLITERGARILLRNARPFLVQTDAVMALTATFDPTFQMFWTAHDIAHPTYLRRSSLWDGCVKCYAPLSGLWYVIMVAVFLVSGVGTCLLARQVKRADVYMTQVSAEPKPDG